MHNEARRFVQNDDAVVLEQDIEVDGIGSGFLFLFGFGPQTDGLATDYLVARPRYHAVNLDAAFQYPLLEATTREIRE